MTIMNELAKQTREMIALAVAVGQFFRLNNAITNTTQALDGLQKHKRKIRRSRKKGGVKEWWNR